MHGSSRHSAADVPGMSQEPGVTLQQRALQKSAVVTDQSTGSHHLLRTDVCPASAFLTVSERRQTFSFKQQIFKLKVFAYMGKLLFLLASEIDLENESMEH